MKKTAMLAFTMALATGCGERSGPGGPLGVAGAILTAPITAPIMFFEARRNDGRVLRDRIEAARRNQSPPPRMDPRSRERAAAALEAALARGAVNEAVYWQNRHDASGHVVGAATVLAKGRTSRGKPCREVLIETTVEGLPTDWRTRTLCRTGGRWREVAAAR